MDPKKLFPDTPDDLTALDDDAVKALLEESEKAVELIVADDAEFLKGLSADQVIEQLEPGVEFVKSLMQEFADREAANENYKAKVAETAKALAAENNDDDDDGAVTEEAEVVAEAEAVTEEAAEAEVVEEQVAVTASVPAPRYSRTPPAPAVDRISVSTVEPQGTALVAAGEMSLRYPEPLTPNTFGALVRDTAMHLGPHSKTDPVGKYRFGGPETKIARADFTFPEDRVLTGNLDEDSFKIKQKIPQASFAGFGEGTVENGALTASGGICAPPTPFYTMPNFGTTAEPVWDALPVFQAARGGVNVPAATYIADITTAISSISEENDALGGTFATKSCQDLTCPAYTETFVNIVAHCREYGNLNARTWPEKIAHENAITMQAMARTSEDFILERIKALSVNVTNGVETLGALIYLVDAIVKSAFGIRGRLRMPREARFTAMLPSYTLDLLLLDTIQNRLDTRYKSKGDIDAYLRSTGIDPVYYLDGNFAAGDDQLPDAAQTAAAIDGFPNTVQWALHPQGAFLGIDSGSLELGIVRDSVLNATNDFQVFGERFRNVARIAPAQAAYWVTTDWCPSGQFPPDGTARTCE